MVTAGEISYIGLSITVILGVIGFQTDNKKLIWVAGIMLLNSFVFWIIWGIQIWK